MAKTGLIILGLLILIGSFYILNVAITSEEKQNIEFTHTLCESKLGSVGKFLSGGITEGCEDNKYWYYGITYGWGGYVLGGLLLLIGLAGGSKKEEVGEVKEETKEIKEENTKRKIFCLKCGSEYYESEKFCSKCGSELNQDKDK